MNNLYVLIIVTILAAVIVIKRGKENSTEPVKNDV